MAVPSVPQNLTITFPSATTALLKWSPPASTGGLSLSGYEVSQAEGAAVGTTYVATGSRGTQFLVKGLKRGMQWTFGVRAANSDGAGVAASVTGRTPIASLHNALFFRECVNYRDSGGRVSKHGNVSNILRAVADNDYETFSTETDYAVNIAVGTQPTRVDAVFVKSTGVASYSGVPSGGSGSGWSSRPIPATVKNWEGADVNTIVNGFQHDLYLLPQHFTAKTVRITFAGTNVHIYELMLLEFGLEIDANSDFTEISPDFVDRTGVVQTLTGGGLLYDPTIAKERNKWEIDYTVKVTPNRTLLQTPEEFLYWRAENRNHVHAQEPSRFPWRVFPATFLRERVPVRYRTDDKLGGEVLNFRVAEQ